MKSTYQNKDWDSLSAAAKAEIAKVAIQKGIYSLDGIKSMYNEFAMGGDTRKRMPAHPRNREDDPEAFDAAQQWKVDMQQRRQQEEEQNRAYVEEKLKRNTKAAEEFNRHKDTVMSALSDIANSAPFTGSEVNKAAEVQRQEKLDKWHDTQKAIDATMTAGELAAAGYGVARGLTHFNRMLARKATQSTGQAVSREATRNLVKWNNRVKAIDKPQIAMNVIGGGIDGYQWMTADNSFDAWENGMETGANVAGIFGGTNRFKLDAILDGLGYGAAAWDIVKHLPPLSGALENIRQQSINKKAYGGPVNTSNVKLGRRYWQAKSNAPTILEKKNTWVKQQKEQNDRKVKALRKYIKTEGVKELNKEVKDYLTTSNDNTWTSANRNPKNPHLQDRVTKGAKSHALWEKEHPVLNTWGNVLDAVPFAVASAPLAAAAGSGMAALGDAVAATSAGQAITAGLAPLATAASTNIAGAPLYTWADVGLSSLFGGHGVQTAINEGGISPTTALEIAPLGRLARPMWDAGKQGLQYTTKAIDNATRYASPSYDLYRTIGETPVSKGSFQRSLTEDFGIFAGPKRVTVLDTPYRQTLDDSFNLIKEPTKAPKQYGMRFAGKYGDTPEVLGEDGEWHGIFRYYKNKKFSDPIDNSIIIGKETKYQPTDYLFHYDRGNYPIHYNTDGSPMLHRLPDLSGDLGPIWWNENVKWGEDRSFVHPRLIKAPDYGKYRQNLVGDNIGDPDAILTGDYPLKDAEFLERDNLLGTMRRGIFAQQPTVKTVETPTIEWTDAVRPPQITPENASSMTIEQWTAAQDAAIAEGDMDEALRLRNLHFMTKAPTTAARYNSYIPTALQHGTDIKNHYVFGDELSFFNTHGGYDYKYRQNVYVNVPKLRVTNPKGYEIGHEYDVLLDADKGLSDGFVDLGGSEITEAEENYLLNNMNKVFGITPEEYRKLYETLPNYKDPSEIQLLKNDYPFIKFQQSHIDSKGIGEWYPLVSELAVKNPKNIKLADAVTYDDNGVRIPLGLRDNFNINEIRWGLLPFGVGLTGYGLLNNQKALGGSINRGDDNNTYYAGTLPEVTTEAYAPMKLTTYYPVVSKYPYTGHSELEIPIDRTTWWDYTGEKQPEGPLPRVTIDKKSGAPDYNLVTNNCADATLNYLNKAFNTHESPMLFTTPGDVRDYAIHKLHGKLVHNNDGSDTVFIPRNARNKTKISKEALDLYSNGPKRTTRIAHLASFNK